MSSGSDLPRHVRLAVSTVPVGDWEGADETVRDLARAMIPGANGHNSSQTVDDLRLQPQYQAAPGVGRASDLAQPGGFRRVHVLESVAGTGAAASEYARQPLVTTLLKQGRTGSFVTDLVQLLEDGTAVRFESRPYRRGRKPVAVRTEGGPPPPPRPPLQYCGFRPYSVPYWVGMAFLVGATLFTVGSVDWMLPYVGDTARGAPLWAATYSTTYPFFVGGLCFIAGCYLSLVEVVNANLGEEIRISPELIDPSGSVFRHGSSAQLRSSSASLPSASPLPSQPAPPPPPHACSTELLHAPMLHAPPPMPRPHGCGGCRVRWWGWQPRSLLYWGALVQLLSAIVFQVACYAILPGVLEQWTEAAGTDGHQQEVYWVYIPSVLGSLGFVFASYVYVVEVTHDYNIFRPPSPSTYGLGSEHGLGYGVARLNLAGSLLFLLASAGYFVQAPPYGHLAPWEELVSLWAVRFPFAAGSACFVAASLLMLPESLSD